MEFKGKTVFITGANRGIGAALVEACLDRGATKVYAATRDKNKLPAIQDTRIVPIELDSQTRNKSAKPHPSPTTYRS